MADLRLILDAIVPENIKNIPLIRDSMDIFLVNLEENASVSLALDKIYNQNINLSTSGTAAKANENLRAALTDIYLQSLKRVIINAQEDEELIKRLKFDGKESALILLTTPEHILNGDYFATGKSFKETTGTVQSIQQAHNIAKILESNNDRLNPTITEPSKFNLVIESTLTGNMYEKIVAPLSHPVGFVHSYIQIVELSLRDYFGVNRSYDVKSIEVRGSIGTFDVFSSLPEPQATDAAWLNFSTRINIITGNVFTLVEFQTLVTVFSNKNTVSITENITPAGRNVVVIFSDDTAVVQDSTAKADVNVQHVIYSTWLATGLGIIKSYKASAVLGHFSLFTDYIVNFSFDYYDVIENWFNTFEISALSDSTGATSDITYTDSQGNLIPIDTSDHIIMSSSNYVLDVFDGLAFTTTGLYFTGSGTTYFTTTEPGSALGYYIVVS